MTRPDSPGQPELDGTPEQTDNGPETMVPDPPQEADWSPPLELTVWVRQ